MSAFGLHGVNARLAALVDAARFGVAIPFLLAQRARPRCFDSLGDLNFMGELLIVVWTIRRNGCWIIGG